VGSGGGAANEANGTHRGHHQFLAKALVYLMPEGIDPKVSITASIQDLLQRTLAEIVLKRDEQRSAAVLVAFEDFQASVSVAVAAPSQTLRPIKSIGISTLYPSINCV
jgi:hypothetical protein